MAYYFFVYRLPSLMIQWSFNRLMTSVPWKPDLPVEDLVSRWAVPPSMFLDVKGLKVHLRDEGPREDRVPIVLIHGTSSSLQTWEGWVDALKEERRVITFDLPGFGLTGPNTRDDYRIESYVRFVLDLLDALRVTQCVLGGNSLGGDIAWHLAAAVPPRVQRLILVDAAGYPMPHNSKSGFLSVAGIPGLNGLLRFVLSRSAIESGLKKLYGNPSRVTPALVERHVQLMRREGNRQALIRAVQQSNIGADAQLIKTVKQPTLIIWGGRDRLLPPHNAKRFHREISGSRLEMFNDLGHMPQEEDADLTVAVVHDFVKIRQKEGLLNEKSGQAHGGPDKWKFIKSIRAKISRLLNR